MSLLQGSWTENLWGRLAACGQLAVGLVRLRNQPPDTVRLHMQFGREPCFRHCGPDVKAQTDATRHALRQNAKSPSHL